MFYSAWNNVIDLNTIKLYSNLSKQLNVSMFIYSKSQTFILIGNQNESILYKNQDNSIDFLRSKYFYYRKR